MAKERVIVFDGEDKFIAKKGKEFNKITGFANVVGAEGETISNIASPETPTTVSDALVIPNPSDADFCTKADEFIRTNGGGRATPDVVMQVFSQFQANCQRPQPDVEPTLLTIDWDSLSCDEINTKIQAIQDLLAVARMVGEERARYEAALERGNAAKVQKCGVTPPALPDVPPPPTPAPLPAPTPKPASPLVNLGVPPARGGAASGGGSGDKKEEKKSNLWIWLLVAAGAYLLLSSDKKN